jgi:hypothetical protein
MSTSADPTPQLEPLVEGSTRLVMAPLTTVPEGEEYLVGSPEAGVFVLLPAMAVELIDRFRAGYTLDQAAAFARTRAGEDVDVADFVASLLELGFARVRILADAAPTPDDAPARAGGERPFATVFFGRAAWTAYGGAALAALGLLALHPRLFPRVGDLFFLATPVRSLAALTLFSYLLAAAHEAMHWLAARAVGVSARVAVSRRLYFLVLETDLTGLWGLPRRQRFGPLLAGMVFDADLLFLILLARVGDIHGWWVLPAGLRDLLAALAFVQFAALVAQFWIFARTDVYALLVTATGCTNLYRVTQLSWLRALRWASPAQRQELAGAHRRDLEVARWYRWVWGLGMALAAWFFLEYFLPATLRLVRWLAASVVHESPATFRFWEALVFAVLVASPRLLTLLVALRDLRNRSRSSPARNTAAAGPRT